MKRSAHGIYNAVLPRSIQIPSIGIFCSHTRESRRSYPPRCRSSGRSPPGSKSSSYFFAAGFSAGSLVIYAVDRLCEQNHVRLDLDCAQHNAAVSVEKYGCPVPPAKNTTIPLLRNILFARSLENSFVKEPHCKRCQNCWSSCQPNGKSLKRRCSSSLSQACRSDPLWCGQCARWYVLSRSFLRRSRCRPECRDPPAVLPEVLPP